MEELKQESMKDWVDEELKEASTPIGDFERLPAPIFEQNKITRLVIDASKPFGKWIDEQKHKVKKIIPCTSEGVKCNFWCNTKNPVYRCILEKIKAAPDKSNVPIAIIQTGTGANTKYELVKE